MKKYALAATIAATLACASVGAQAQTAYVGLGAPGILTLGYAQPMGKAGPLGGDWGLRGEFAGGISLSQTETEDGALLTAKLRSNRVGAFADWFPTSSKFRVVGGLTYNDIKVALNTAGGEVEIDGNTVDLTNERFNITIKYPTFTPYIGIGWGHRDSAEKGLGFFADVGVTIGRFKATVDTTVVTSGQVSQAELDAELKKINDSVGKLPILPSVSIGVNYRF